MLKTNKGEKDDYTASISISGTTEESALGSEAGSLLFEKSLAREQSITNPTLESVRWLTTNEAAQYLRVSVSSIKMMIYRGQLRVHKLGRRNRFLRDELERLITFPVSNRRC